MKTCFSAALLIFGTVAVPAGVRTSADYTVAADGMDSSGHRSTAGLYTMDQSLGDSGGSASAATQPYVARQGYTGQLYDPAGLSVDLTPQLLPETATGQLTSMVINDDDTFFPVDPATVAWTLLSGPVERITAEGMVRPGPVYADSPASIGGMWGGLQDSVDVVISNTDPDNYFLYAGDSIDDGWQVSYFGEQNPAGLPGADPDADGQDNLFEYNAGLEPDDPLSLFGIAITSPGGSRKNVEFGPLRPGRHYILESSTDLSLWNPVPSPALISDDGVLRVLQDGQAIEARKFYRITIQKS